MGNKTKENYEIASQRYQNILNDIQEKPDDIKKLLESSCNLYRYDFAEQMMIVSANPNAKAVATYDQWNRINCAVKKGSKAIPIAMDNGRVKYVFDIEQIKTTPYSRLPKEWKMDSSMEERIASRLDKDFGIPKGNYTFADKIMALSESFAKEMRDETIESMIEDGIIGENVPDAFADSVECFMASVMAYSMMKRLDIDTDYYEKTGRINFESMKQFDTDVISVVSDTICSQSGEVLHTIAKEVTQIEFERRMEHGRNEVSQRGRLSNSEHKSRTAGRRAADVGREVHQVQEEKQTGMGGMSQDERNTASDSNRGSEISRGHGKERDGTSHERVRSDNGTSQQQSARMDKKDEQNQGRSGEHDNDGNHLRITSFERPTLNDGSAPAIPSQAEQLGNILTKMVQNNEMPDEVRIAFKVLYSYMSEDEKGSILAFRELGRENGQADGKIALKIENSVPVLDDKSDGIAITNDESAIGFSWENVGKIIDKDIEKGTFLKESQREDILEQAQAQVDISEENNLEEFMDSANARLTSLKNTPIPVGDGKDVEKQLRDFSLKINADNEPFLSVKYRKYAVDELGKESGLRGFTSDGFIGCEAINKHLSEMEEKAANYLRQDRAFAPIVTIEWSEHDNPLLANDMRMGLSQANALFELVDSVTVDEAFEKKQEGIEDGIAYYKTKFDIAYQMDDEIRHYTGRQDFGDGDGSLINHISESAKANAEFLRSQGDIAGAEELEHSIEVLVPYFEAHMTLSAMEENVLNIYQSYERAGAEIEPAKKEKLDSVLSYVNESRNILNHGGTELPSLEIDISDNVGEKDSMNQSVLNNKKGQLADVTERRTALCGELATEFKDCLSETMPYNSKVPSVDQLKKSLMSAKRRTHYLNQIKDTNHFPKDRIGKLEDMCKEMSELGKQTHSLKKEIENLESDSLSEVAEKHPQIKEMISPKEPEPVPVKKADVIDLNLDEGTISTVSMGIPENQDVSFRVTSKRKLAQDLEKGDRIQFEGKEYTVKGNSLFGGVRLEDDNGQITAVGRPHLNEQGFSIVADDKSIEENTIYKIYQLKDSEEYHFQRFESFEDNKGAALNYTDYDEVYSGEVKLEKSDKAVLNGLYEKFNIDRPEDFKGHSLSVSDVIVLSENNEDRAFYVDRFGFAPFDDFYKEKEIREETKDITEALSKNADELQVGDVIHVGERALLGMDGKPVTFKPEYLHITDVNKFGIQYDSYNNADLSGEKTSSGFSNFASLENDGFDYIKNVSFFVAEAMEFHSLGSVYENIPTIEQAVDIFDNLPDSSRNMGNGIGVMVNGEEYSLYENGDIDTLEFYEESIQKDGSVLNAVKVLNEHFSVTTEKVNDVAENSLTEEMDSKIESEVNGPVRNEEQGEATPSMRGSDAVNVPVTMSEDFKITDYELGKGTKGEKLRGNLEAIRTLKLLEDEKRPATYDEKVKLSQYVGWGGLSEIFDNNKTSFMSERQELKEILTEEEYKAARHSVMDSYYTAPQIIEAIYDKLADMGLAEGKMLEPSCGVGNFIGMKPDSMKNLSVTGVELDSVSGRIASMLYPNADIKIQGFEKTNLPDDSFDVAVGNVPFGEIKPYDKQYKKDNLLIHDYFFVKALDKVKAGGVVAFVTSNGTMDKANSHARELMTQKADFLGAVRLPNNAFKENAGAEVTTDIIFLQKKEVPTVEFDKEFASVGKNENGIEMNQYFVNHPEQICGHMELISSQFGFKAACIEDEGVALPDRLKESLSNIDGKISTVSDLVTENEIGATPTFVDTTDARNYSYILQGDDVYFKADSDICELVTDKDGLAISGKAKERIVGMCDLRDKTYDLLNIQLDVKATEEDIKQAQADLLQSYEAFEKKNGRINDRGNALAFREDDSYTLLSSLEKLDDDGKFIGLADIFTKRTVEPTVEVTHADNPHDALIASINQKAMVDIPYMASLCEMTEDDVKQELLENKEIFIDPSNGNHVTADEYLSGNVREKLHIAEEMAEIEPSLFKSNVDELKKVQPEDLQASDISVRLGSTWIPPEVIVDFCKEKLNVPENRFYSWGSRRPDIDITYDERTSKWNITNKRSVRNAKCTVEFGSERKTALELLETALNLGTAKITYKDPDTDKTLVDEKATKEIMAKQTALQDEFKNWVFDDPDRRDKLVTLYNERFNNIRPREYDGGNLTFAGMNPSITLNDHQKNAVARQVFGGNTLLAHCVGAGKTFTMAAAGMEMKRVGTCKKPLYVVPKALVGQWAKEFTTLYPTAKVLAAGEHDFDPANRKKMTAKIATGNYDAVIISHSQFQKIPLSAEKQQEYIQREIDETMQFLEENAGDKGFSVRQAEATLDKLQKKMEALADFDTDSVITFEQLGVDHLFVDESHNYKNLHTDSKLNVSGINKSAAQKSSDMLYKCQYLNEITGCKGVTFATGTPVSNSMSELYVNMKYLQPDVLEQMHCSQFDQWAANFGSVVTAMEFDVTGQKFHAKSRFAEFFNLPELMSAFKEAADVRTTDMLDLKVPEHNTHTIAVEPSDFQLAILDSIVERCDQIRDGNVNPQEDNMLKVTTDGRLLAFDQKLYEPSAPDNPNSKINKCVEVAYDIYKKGMEDKCTQMIFSDLGVPPANKGNTDKFNAYQDIKDKLIAKGVPADEIAIIHEWDSDKKKPILQSKMRAGEIRFLIGSTQKCGTGLNVQNKLKALHHLDVPWKPSDIEQREGRIIRQGNEYYDKKEPVDIFRYVTEKTFDTYSWQIIEQKQKFVGQIMTSKSPVRSMTDLDNSVLEAATAKAIACGNPKLIEKVNLEKEVDSLKIAKATHTQTRYSMQDLVMKKIPSQIETTQEALRNQLNDMRIYNANKFDSTDKSAFHITVAGKEYTDKAEGGQALIDTAKKEMFTHNGMIIGEFKGFPIKVNYDFMRREATLSLVGKASHNADLSTDPHGMISRLDNQLERIAVEIIPRLENHLDELDKELQHAQEELDKPFPKEEELVAKQKRLDELNEELLADMSNDTKPSDQIRDNDMAISESKEVAVSESAPVEDANKRNFRNFTLEEQDNGKFTLYGEVQNNVTGDFEKMCLRKDSSKEEISDWAAKHGVDVKDLTTTIKGVVTHKKNVIDKKGDTPTVDGTEVKRQNNNIDK